MNPLLETKINLLSTSPGCYLMKNKDGQIIYVGKAKSLIKRVKQYFYRPQVGKVARMVHEIDSFETIEVATEKESLLLEISLIQKYYPKYNILLKDGKSYPFIALKKSGDAYLKIAYHDKEAGYIYFGPFPNSSAAYQMLTLLNHLFPLRKCRNIPLTPCLYYHLGQCLGPCINKISQDVTDNMRDKINKFLSGNDNEIVKETTKKMKEASASLQFEKAEEYKELLNSIKHVTDNQKIILQDHANRDVIGYSLRDGYLSVLFLLYRNGVLLGSNLFVVESEEDATNELNDESALDNLLSSIIYQFYLVHPKPTELLISEPKLVSILESTLSLKVVIPKIGKKKELLALAFENAKKGLDEHFQTSRLEDNALQILEELGKSLGIPTPLDIELFDNSHFQGSESIGAMVKYINGNKVSKAGRHYNIQGENKKDDYASMEEICFRRYLRLNTEGSKFPDLIIVDGGLGQINACLKALARLELKIPVAGLAKNDKHETASLIYGDKVIGLDRKSPLFFMLMRMQDEVHRYAISFHRNKRSKTLLDSFFNNIPGLGKTGQLRLATAYPSFESLKDATLEELKQFVTEKTALKVIEKRDLETKK